MLKKNSRAKLTQKKSLPTRGRPNGSGGITVAKLRTVGTLAAEKFQYLIQRKWFVATKGAPRSQPEAQIVDSGQSGN